MGIIVHLKLRSNIQDCMYETIGKHFAYWYVTCVGVL